MALLKKKLGLVEPIPDNPSTNPSSIDVLLSNIDAEGLTASTLQDSITKLDTRYIETMLSLFSTSSQVYSKAIDTSSPNATQDLLKEAAFSSSLATLHSKNLTTDSSTSTIASLASQHADAATQLHSTLQALSEATAMADLHQRLLSYDTLVSQAQYHDAATIIIELQSAVSTVPGMDSSAHHVTERAKILQDYLSTIPPQYLLFPPIPRIPPTSAIRSGGPSPSTSTFVPSLHPPVKQTAGMFMQVWKAAGLLGVLDEGLMTLSNAVVERCIAPMIAVELAQLAAVFSSENLNDSPCRPQHHHQQQQQSSIGVSSPAHSIASSAFSTVTTNTAAAAAHAGLSIERCIYKCLKFLYESVFSHDAQLVGLFGSHFWPAVSDAYISAKLMPLVPTNDAELDVFTKAGALGIKLEQKAAKVGMIAMQNEGPIARFVRQSMSKALGEKRTRFVCTARDTLAEGTADVVVCVAGDNYTTSSLLPSSMRSLQFDPGAERQQHGVSPHGVHGPPNSASTTLLDAALKELDAQPSPYAPPSPYRITAVVDRLCELMHLALQEGCRSGSNILALEMCRAVVDMASLLVAMPSRTPEQEKKVAYFGAVRYNDCMHVYRTLCTLPQAHAPRLQLLVHRNVNFAAPAERVKKAGESALLGVLTEQKKELLTMSHDILSWGTDIDDAEIQRRDKIVQQIVHSCVRVGTVLYDVLPLHAFVDSMASLLNGIAKHLADDIIAQRDIAEDESRVVPRVLQKIYEKDHGIVSSLVEALPTVRPSGEGEQAQHTTQEAYSMLASATKDVLRLQEVCEILDISSKDIARRWASGRLRAAGLGKDDVIGMIHALFEDTVYRQRSIAMIMQH